MLTKRIAIGFVIVAAINLGFSWSMKTHGTPMDFVQKLNGWAFFNTVSIGSLILISYPASSIRNLIAIFLFILSLCFIYPFLPLAWIKTAQMILNVLRVMLVFFGGWIILTINLKR